MGAFAIALAEFKTSFGRDLATALTATGAAVWTNAFLGIATALLALTAAGVGNFAADLAGDGVGLAANLATAFTATATGLDLDLGLATVFTGALTTALDGTGFLTAGLAAFTGLAGTFITLAAGLAFAAVDAALAVGLALTATFGAAFLAATLTNDLLDVFTSCLLAVQLTRTECASPSHRTQSVHLHQNPWVGPSGAGGPNKGPCQGGDCSDRTSQKLEWSGLNSGLSQKVC